MAAPAPEFKDSFIVERDNYGAFIRIVRQNVIRYCSDRTNVAQPVLPPEERVPRLLFHVVLRAPDELHHPRRARRQPLHCRLPDPGRGVVGFPEPWFELFLRELE
ncbi:unnamed protein product [Urochloa humidicola]